MSVGPKPHPVVVVAAPANPFITDATVYAHLRVDTSGSPPAPTDADFVGHLRDAVEDYLSGPGGVLGRQLITSTLQVTYDRFPCAGETGLVVPLPPLAAVSAVTYVDTAGATQTWASSNYTVVNEQRLPSRVVLAYGASWPSTRDVPQAVTITYTAGYGDDAADVPAALRQAGLLMIGDLYENREAQSADYEIRPNPAAERLLAGFFVR